MPLNAFVTSVLLVPFILIATVASAQDMALSTVLLDNEPWQLVGEGFTYTEGPAADAQGNLYFSDPRASKIYRLDANGKPEVYVQNSFGANGLMFGPGGRLYACQNGKQQIVAYDPQGNEHVIASGVASNDLVVTGAGGVYFTDPTNHRVWYVDPEGNKRVVDEGIERPNGINLWPAQGTLVVADTLGKHLWTFRVERDGSLKYKQPYYTMALLPGRTESGADGMTIDSAGRLYVATHAGLQMFDPTGRLSGVIAKPQSAKLSNVCFGGPKLDTLYATSTDKVYLRKTKTTGVSYSKANTKP